ncbi:MAG: hypothetical protein R3F60_25250 [bacterium]
MHLSARHELRALARAASLLGLIALGACAEDENRSPSILPLDDLTIRVNMSGRVDVTAADPDDDRLSFEMRIEPEPPTQTQGAAGRPSLTRISNNQAVFSWTPGVADAGGGRSAVYAVTFIVTDGRGGRATETVQLTVENPGVGGAAGLRFISPSGAGMVVDLSQTPCIPDPTVVEVAGELVPAEDVRLVLGDPAPAGALVSPDGPGKRKNLTWCPTPEQVDESQTWTLSFVASWPEADAPVTKRFSVRFIRSQVGPGCPGQPPVINHVSPGELSGPLNYELEATISDDLGFKSPPVVAYTTAAVDAARPDISGWSFEPFTRVAGDQWRASLPNLRLAEGATQVISYMIIAEDNDDAGGARCDHVTQSPVFQFTARGGQGGGGQTYGFCAPCVSDAQCGGGGDRCVDLQGEAFCGRSCEQADCRAGEQCLIVDSVDGVSSAQCLPADLNCGQLCMDDVFEAGGRNDLPEQATLLEPGSFPGLTICGDDYDFFRVPVQAGESLAVSVQFEHARGDIDLAMSMPGDAGEFPYLSNGYENEESVFEPCAAETGEALIAVVGYQQPRNLYTLDVRRAPGQCNLECEDDAYDRAGGNDTADDFVPVQPPFFEQGLAICPRNADFYGFDASAGQIIGAAIGFNHAAGDLDLRLYRSSGELLARSANTLDGEVIEIAAPTDDFYLLEVYGATRSVANRYDLEIQLYEVQRCQTTQSCPPGAFCGEGICLDAACAGFGDCGRGHGCVPDRAGLDPGTAGGTCLPDCASDQSCRAGETCKRFEDFARRCAPAGVGGTGSRCGGYQDCAGDLVCFPVPGGYCAAGGCGADLVCGADAVCGQLLGFDACLKRCQNDGDCRVAEGYSCRDVGGGQRGCVR